MLLFSSLKLFNNSRTNVLNSSILLFCNSIFCSILFSNICIFSSYNGVCIELLVALLLELTKFSILSSINFDNNSSSVNSVNSVSNSLSFKS